MSRRLWVQILNPLLKEHWLALFSGSKIFSLVSQFGQKCQLNTCNRLCGTINILSCIAFSRIKIESVEGFVLNTVGWLLLCQSAHLELLLMSVFSSSSHVEYIKDGLKHMQLKFYIQGAEPRMQGTVHTEMKEVRPYPYFFSSLISQS